VCPTREKKPFTQIPPPISPSADKRDARWARSNSRLSPPRLLGRELASARKASALPAGLEEVVRLRVVKHMKGK
jgi:hypothetical protein